MGNERGEAFEPANEYNDGSFQDADREELRRLGKKQVLRRGFRFLSILGFSCAVLITWEASLILFLTGLQNGGHAGIVYGYIVIWVGNLAVFTTLSELVSMAPTSGGQYHWVAMLAPKSSSKFLSYITGWLTVAGWQAGFASACFLTGSMIQGLVTLTNPSYSPKSWHTALILWAVALYCVFINAVTSRLLPAFEKIALAFHIVGFLAVLIPLVKFGVKNDASLVFKNFINEGGWSSQGVSFLVGLIGNAFAFLGLDGAYHMSEEIQNPSITVPRSIILTLFINGSLGLAMLIATLFSIVNLPAALASPTGFPFMEIFVQATGSIAGSATMASVIVTLALFANCNYLASTSRMTWSFARDRGLPGWKALAKVERRTEVPLTSVLVTAAITILLSLIVIGSTTAFNIIVSLTVACLYVSYLTATILLLYHRCTGSVSYPSSTTNTGPALANTTGARLVWGPWHVRGALGIAINIFGCIYLTVILIFSFFPAKAVPTAGDMNYSVVIWAFVVVFSVVYYLAYARRVYEGPLVEVDTVPSMESRVKQ
ncbi:uncharacterized protein GIQ15_01482 [Arthroderma uncinatum]|uniref:uncharacterized protein n=1 Tax=Arthroderma uncinatum TaxID=74035 RepID=UPI00144A4CDE|nr:uncharacterized protein GIQ15_01482 [Arthroderma uncinatum]KAF3491965.1 hypothetical protein GIQ15_01482 [Arthroderma uncinatum]